LFRVVHPASQEEVLVAIDPGYVLDNAAPQADERFASLAELFDDMTFQHMARLGVGPGWRCAELGAGGPSVVAWLADRVGAAGLVLGTDIDPRWVGGDHPAHVRIERHDITREPLPERDLDLVHARLVLTHLPQRMHALHEMVAALRPGGWLLIEDFDLGFVPGACPDAVGPAERAVNAVRDAFQDLLVRGGVDVHIGRTLPRLLGELGLTELGASGHTALGGSAVARLERANLHQTRGGLVAAGMVTDAEVDAALAVLDDVVMSMPTLVSAWGRRA
jgi:SAM-dependent methyltransferase